MGYEIFLLLLTISAIYEYQTYFKNRCVHWEDINENCSEIKWEYNETVHQLLIYFKKTYDSVRRKVLYDILIEFGAPKKLVRLTKMCLNETYYKVRNICLIHFLLEMAKHKQMLYCH
jgi:hypothetical protein